MRACDTINFVGFRSIGAYCVGLLATSAALSAQVAVTTQRNNVSRTGVNPNETILNASKVNVNTFGKLFSRAVDGQIYAQPLYVPNVQVPSQGVHNIVYVVTEQNSVYAFDADDPAQSASLWHVNFGAGTAGVLDALEPELGISSTPVIDTTSGTLYVVAQTAIPTYQLHALDIATGDEKFNGPVTIQGSVPGIGGGSSNGVLTFDPALHFQRPGLLLENGKVYIGFGSHGNDQQPFHGWLFGYDAATLQQTTHICLTPNGNGGGVWTGGQGLTADASGNIYVSTGNGTLDANTGGKDYGDSIVKLTSNGLTVSDYFAPSNQAALEAADADFGSTGPILLPGTSLGVAGGKDGRVFLFNTGNLGQFHTNSDQVVQEWQATTNILTGKGGSFGTDWLYYNSKLYVWGNSDFLRAFAFNGSTFNTTPVSVGTIQAPYVSSPYSYSNAPSMSLSANGTSPGTAIIWAAYSSNGGSDGNAYPGILRAFDAADVSKELWNSDQYQARDDSGSWAKWNPPTIANGKVYLGTFDGVLNVFGLLVETRGGGALSGEGDSSETGANLTTEGPADWVHWGDASPNRKAGVTAQISNYKVVGAATVYAYNPDLRPLSWTDGTPTASSINNENGLYIGGNGNGFSFTVPADTGTRTLAVHVGGWESGGTFTAHLSDGSVADFTDTTPNTAAQYDRNYTLVYNAASAGQTLTVTWTMTSGTGNVTLSGAALVAGQSIPGSISGSGTSSTTGANLTAEGAADWVHWGDASLNRKAGVTAQISNYKVVGAATVYAYNPDLRPLSWTDGTPTASSINNENGLYIGGNGNGCSFTVPADTGTRTLAVHVGGWESGGTFTAHLSDGSVADFTDTTPNTVAQYDRNYTLVYNAASASQTLTVTWTMTSGTGNVTLSGAALATGLPLVNGHISAAGDSSTTGANLTTEGPADWVHWGDASLNRKAGVTAQISNYKVVGAGTVYAYNPDLRPLSWTDGTPNASSTNNRNGLYISGIGNGFSFTVPAATATRTLTVHVGGWESGGSFTAHLSDGSSADLIDTTPNTAAQYDCNYVLTYNAASSGQTLTVTWTLTSGTGNVTLSGAALQ